MKELQAIVRTLLAAQVEGAVLATLVAAEGSSYRRPGARLLLLPDGTRLGSISGGCLEEDVIARARRVAATGTPELISYDTKSENDLVWGVGLGCHGIVHVLLERLGPRPAWANMLNTNFRERRATKVGVVYSDSDHAALGTRIVTDDIMGKAFVQSIRPPAALHIFGAGDDARPLVRLGKELGWIVTVGDPRPAFATLERFPEADATVVAPAAELADGVRWDEDTIAVIMTHHYVHDVPLLRAALQQPNAYVGLLGPKLRADRILDDLKKDGFSPTPDQRRRLHAPVGLDLGADGAEQVAVAVIAEIQAVLSGRSARPLRERTSPIHAEAPR